MTTRIIAVLNQKGGVGKTTTCVNLGAALTRHGHRVLLIDMDPQANLTVHMGIEPHSREGSLERTSYSLLLGKHSLGDAVLPTETPGLMVVPSTLALANAEVQLAGTVGRELVLREALGTWLSGSDAPDAGNATTADARPTWSDEVASTIRTSMDDLDQSLSEGGGGEPRADFVIIDCPPSLGTLTMNALCASGEVILPIQTEFFALQGVAGILESVKAVKRLNPALRLSMVVPSMVDRRTTLTRDVIEEIRGYFGDLVSRTEIRKNVKLAEAPSHGKSIFAYEPRCNGAQDYASLALEVLGEYPDEEPEEEPEESQPEEKTTEPSAATATTDLEPEPDPDRESAPEPAADEPTSGIRLPASAQDADPQNADPQNADPQNADPQNADPQNADPQRADTAEDGPTTTHAHEPADEASPPQPQVNRISEVAPSPSSAAPEATTTHSAQVEAMPTPERLPPIEAPRDQSRDAPRDAWRTPAPVVAEPSAAESSGEPAEQRASEPQPRSQPQANPQPDAQPVRRSWRERFGMSPGRGADGGDR